MKGRQFWTVAETRGSAECEAARNASAQDYPVYNPQYRIRRNSAGVRRVVSLFAGYLFVDIGREGRWSPLCGTRGIVRLIMDGERPARVGADFIESVRSRENELGYVQLDSEEPPVFSLLQPVSPVRGTFAKQKGVYLGPEASQRCRVLFSMLGREVERVMSVHDLVLA